jgi:hypothetical protein
MWFDGGRMRTERLEGDGDSQMALFRNQALYAVDPKSKTYRVIDKPAADRMATQMSEGKKMLEAQMAGMTPEQRARMQEMMAKMGGGGLPGMPGAKPQQRSLKNTGRTETVAGIKCTIWEVTVDGQKDQEQCAAPAGSLPGGDEIMKVYREISTLMSSFTASLSSGSDSFQPWNDMEKINGIPILAREFEGGKATSEMRMTVVRKESVPGAKFEVPAGFTEQKMPAGFGGGGQ